MINDRKNFLMRSIFLKVSGYYMGMWRLLMAKKLDVTIVSVAIVGLLLGVRQIGWLQPLELVAFDFMIRLRPDEKPDPRLLVVKITEKDIDALKQLVLPTF